MEPLSVDAAVTLADHLGDHPFSFGARCALERRMARAWTVGPPSEPRAAVVQLSWVPSEPLAFGDDPEAVWTILRELPGWTCINAATRLAAAVAPVLERELGAPTRLYGDVYFVLDVTPRSFAHPSVRRLTDADAEMVEEAPLPLRPVGFLSMVAALTGGVVAGAVEDGRLVAAVSMSTSSETYADVGAHTLAPHRGRGFATAAASIVARAIVERDLVPVWSTGEDNLASRRVAEKVGFREFGREAYVIVPALKSQGGFRPIPPAA